MFARALVQWGTGSIGSWFNRDGRHFPYSAATKREALGALVCGRESPQTKVCSLPLVASYSRASIESDWDSEPSAAVDVQPVRSTTSAAARHSARPALTIVVAEARKSARRRRADPKGFATDSVRGMQPKGQRAVKRRLLHGPSKSARGSPNTRCVKVLTSIQRWSE